MKLVVATKFTELVSSNFQQKHFNKIRMKNEELLEELEHAGLREMDALEYYANQKGNVFVSE